MIFLLARGWMSYVFRKELDCLIKIYQYRRGVGARVASGMVLAIALQKTGHKKGVCDA